MKIRLEPLQPNERFRVEYALRPNKPNMPSSHYHDCYEIYYFLGNKAIYFIENKSFEVNTHDVIFIDKFTYHKTWYQNNDTVERFLIYISDKTLKMIEDQNILKKILQLFQKRKLLFPATFNKLMLKELSEKIYPLCKQNTDIISKLRAEFALLELLLLMAELVEKGAAVESNIHFNTKEHKIAQVIDYINNNYNSEITLDMLSKRFFLNKYYLCHVFKEIVGTSIIDYVIEKRLAEAEKLLRYSDYNVTQISQLVGFNNVSYFITLFKRKYNCTPSVFQEKIGKK